MQFRKKPVVVEATQWHKNGDHPQDAASEMFDYPGGQRPSVIREGAIVRYYRHPEVNGDTECKHCGLTMHIHGWIDTLEGGHIVCPGDWIITGVQGENYPCKPDIFAATYEPVLPALSQPPVDNAHVAPGCEQFSESDIAANAKPSCGDFGYALAWLKAGKCVARAGWNGRGQFLVLVQGSNRLASVYGFGFGESAGEPTFGDTMFLRTVENRLVAWAPSQSDALANDWIVIDLIPA